MCSSGSRNPSLKPGGVLPYMAYAVACEQALCLGEKNSKFPARPTYAGMLCFLAILV